MGDDFHLLWFIACLAPTCKAHSTEEKALKMIFLSAPEAHRIKTTGSEGRKDYPHWRGSVTKDILGRRFNFTDEKEQDFLIAIDSPIDLEHKVSWLKRKREFLVFRQARKRSVMDKAKSHNLTESRNLVLFVFEPQHWPHTGTYRHWINAYSID